MQKKVLLSFIFIFMLSFSFDVLGTSQTIKQREHFIKTLKSNNKKFVNWALLFYYAHFSRSVKIGKEDNFIQKSLFEQRKLVQKARSRIFKDVLKIDINNEITVKELLEISSEFQKHLTRRIFSPEILLPSGQAGYKLNMGAFFSFVGKKNLIDLILSSGYFIEREKLIPFKSKYLAHSYSTLIIEARHLHIKPALFPNIYTYDSKGELFLIYSLAHAKRSAIVKNGYAHYYKETKSLSLNNAKNYYCAALKVSGTKQVDIIISREDYLKFFASPLSLKNLSEGNFFIVVKDKKK